MNRSTSFFIILIIFGSNLFAQTPVDSIIIILNHSDDTSNYALYTKLISHYTQVHPDSAMLFCQEALNFAENKNNQKARADFLNRMGHLLENAGDWEKSVKCFDEAYQIYLVSGDYQNACLTLNNAGAVLNDAGKYQDASYKLFEALRIADSIKYLDMEAAILNNIGLLFYYQEEWKKSIDYYQKANQINQSIGDYQSMALIYNNVGIAYYYLEMLDSVLVNFERSLEIYVKLGDKKGQTRPLFNIGEVYSEKGEYKKALEYYERSLKLEEELGYKKGYATSLVFIGEIYSEMGDFSKALAYQRKGHKILADLNLSYEVKDAYNALHQTFSKMHQYDSALYYYKAMSELRDSLYTLDKSKQINELETIYETEKKEQQIALQQTKIKFKNQQTIGLSIILLLSLSLTVYAINANRQKRKANQLLAVKNRELSLRNQLITSSITYASFIQQTIFPDKETFRKAFPESFIFYKPKDIVSGDFYWIHISNGQTIVAVADCTGHGVPGAFMSILGITFLKEIIDINHITQTDAILNTLRDKIVEALHQKMGVNNSRDGLDIALCIIKPAQQTIEYSGAYIPLRIISGGEMRVFKGDKMPIGFHKTRQESFTKQLISYKPGDTLFLASDGMADQFGGPEGKKFGNTRFEEFLQQQHSYPMLQQQSALELLWNDWKKEKEQIDDVVILGLKLV